MYGVNCYSALHRSTVNIKYNNIFRPSIIYCTEKDHDLRLNERETMDDGRRERGAGSSIKPEPIYIFYMI